ncbi:nucleotidyltransferase [Candidatus Thorarchaeota archaeon]|nr:MAG: nucleotidyltransferase [Candidatus Thorarchaeota archaeon]
MAKKPEILHGTRRIVYDDQHWQVFRDFRDAAEDRMLRLEEGGIRCLVYGSVARGDVTERSDIDLLIPDRIPSYRIELLVGKGIRRELVQATPSSVLKGHLYLDYRTTITFPMFRMMSREREFYEWGGTIDLEQVREGARVPGVDKRLILIIPTEDGHIERGVVGYEARTARELNVSIEIAKERVRVLTRRDSVGRTGVYLTHQVPEDSTYEAEAKHLIDRDPALRRTVDKRT